MSRPLLALAPVLGLGCWMGPSLGLGPAAVLLGSGALLLLLACRSRRTVWAWVALCGAALAVGAGAAAVEAAGYAEASRLLLDAASDGERVVRVTGRLRRDPWRAGSQWILLVDAVTI